MSSSTILYNSYNLQTSNIITENIFHTSAPQKDIITVQRPRRNRSLLLDNYWTQKSITANGHILGNSVADLDARIDAFKQNMVGEDNILDIGYNGATRRYTATVQSITIQREHFHTTFVPFSIEFLCNNAFGRDTSLTSVELLNQTSSPFSKNFSMTGSIPAYPTITIHFDSASSITKTEIENTITQEKITITRAFASTKDLVINCDNLSVLYDAIEEDYSGLFPSFVIGNNEIEITITGSAFQADLDISYYQLYI